MIIYKPLEPGEGEPRQNTIRPIRDYEGLYRALLEELGSSCTASDGLYDSEPVRLQELL